jgi:PhnB protein
MIMISEPGVRNAMPAFLYVYVDDTDATYRRAIDAGARVLEEPSETPYGDRRCMVEDKWGNTWQIATHMKDLGAA